MAGKRLATIASPLREADSPFKMVLFCPGDNDHCGNRRLDYSKAFPFAILKTAALTVVFWTSSVSEKSSRIAYF